MTTKQFKALKVGDTVKLAVARPDYTCGHKTPDGRVYIPAGAIGVIGAVKVPAVRVDAEFACVDFPRETRLVDCRGNTVEHWDKCNGFRCAAVVNELE